MTGSGERKTRLDRAGELISSGEYEKAYELLKELLLERRDDTDVMILTASVLVGMGRLDEGEAAFRAVLRVDQENGDALKGLAGLLAATDRADEAVVMLRTRLRLEPEDVEACRGLGDALCRRASMAKGEERSKFFSQAEEAFSRVLDLAGWDGWSAISLAGAKAAQGRNGEALATLQEALQQIEAPVSDRLNVYGEMILFLVMWGRGDDAARGGALLRQEGMGDPEAMEKVIIKLATEARRMADGDDEWKEKAYVLAEILQEIYG